MTTPLVVLVLAAPVLLLLSAVVALGGHGPLGWLAAAALLAAVFVVARATCRRCWTWWLGTKAPVRDTGPGPRCATGVSVTSCRPGR